MPGAATSFEPSSPPIPDAGFGSALRVPIEAFGPLTPRDARTDNNRFRGPLWQLPREALRSIASPQIAPMGQGVTRMGLARCARQRHGLPGWHAFCSLQSASSGVETLRGVVEPGSTSIRQSRLRPTPRMWPARRSAPALIIRPRTSPSPVLRGRSTRLESA